MVTLPSSGATGLLVYVVVAYPSVVSAIAVNLGRPKWPPRPSFILGHQRHSASQSETRTSVSSGETPALYMRAHGTVTTSSRVIDVFDCGVMEVFVGVGSDGEGCTGLGSLPSPPMTTIPAPTTTTTAAATPAHVPAARRSRRRAVSARDSKEGGWMCSVRPRSWSRSDMARLLRLVEQDRELRARPGQSGLHGSFGNAELLSDRCDVEIGQVVQDHDVALVVRQLGQRGDDR